MKISPLPPLNAIFEQMPGCWGCKNTDSTFVHVNKEFSELVGAISPDALVGKTDFDMSQPLSAYAKIFQQQDIQVMKSGRCMRVLNVHPYPDGQWRAHIFTKVPWYSDNGQIKGILFHGQAVNNSAMLEVGQWICKAIGHEPPCPPTKESEHCHQPPLTPRESEVLFLHLYGKKPQSIAKILVVSVKTVENHFANLRIKLGASSKTELVDKALELGIGSCIPDTLLRQQMALVISE
ncbi:helix-turn-helix transcriptional regulator [Enterovibrio norvegicus FF-162]|uniref:helix-turn-helix transcriptional regulator n=1 Tax=Enterovibrio norvegicus TaxID=188144 RepID=UPI000318CBD3|nr:helix-turn-helix transcriptional regulator [Enterovibrio norvegicus]OEE90499.1 helix-turn-helix transcriptional regulator [Enterovibrio norvegicus FF-162]